MASHGRMKKATKTNTVSLSQFSGFAFFWLIFSEQNDSLMNATSWCQTEMQPQKATAAVFFGSLCVTQLISWQKAWYLSLWKISLNTFRFVCETTIFVTVSGDVWMKTFSQTVLLAGAGSGRKGLQSERCSDVELLRESLWYDVAQSIFQNWLHHVAKLRVPANTERTHQACITRVGFQSCSAQFIVAASTIVCPWNFKPMATKPQKNWYVLLSSVPFFLILPTRGGRKNIIQSWTLTFLEPVSACDVALLLLISKWPMTAWEMESQTPVEQEC